MNKEQFDSHYIGKMMDASGKERDVIIFNEADLRKWGVPENYKSTVQVEFFPIDVDEVRPSLRGNGQMVQTAQLRQMTNRSYPMVRPNSGGLFDLEDFGTNIIRAVESTRMSFIDVPFGTQREEVLQRLANKKFARIYTVMANTIILTDRQVAAIEAGILSFDDVAYGRPVDDASSDHFNKRVGGQVVRYGNSAGSEGAEDKLPTDIILQNDREMFRHQFLSFEEFVDIDFRQRATSPITISNTRTFTEASLHQTRLMTADQESHEGRPTPSGGNPSTPELRAAGQMHNYFGENHLPTSTNPNQPIPDDIQEMRRRVAEFERAQGVLTGAEGGHANITPNRDLGANPAAIQNGGNQGATPPPANQGEGDTQGKFFNQSDEV